MQFSDQQLKVHTVETAKDYIDSFKNTANLFLKILNNSRVMVGTLTVYIDVIMDIHYNVIFFVRASPSPYIRDIGLYPFRSLFFISFIPI